MSRARGNVSVAKEISLIDFWIEFRLTRLIGGIARPAHKMRNRASGPVTIEGFQTKAARRQIALYRRERHRRLASQQAKRRFIAIDLAADEIVLAEIADIELEAGHGFRRVDKPGIPRLLRGGHRRKRQKDEEKEGSQNPDQRATAWPPASSRVATAKIATPAAA